MQSEIDNLFVGGNSDSRRYMSRFGDRSYKIEMPDATRSRFGDRSYKVEMPDATRSRFGDRSYKIEMPNQKRITDNYYDEHHRRKRNTHTKTRHSIL